ncbi:MAG: MBL fold metallo-hydrolase [Lachnospiraceae bacterium]|nr:MBL fold metallo-hydrolase [Lachnospiraceae bacterium]
MSNDIKTGRMVLGPVGTNCYFMFREDKKDAIVFDPADRGADIFNALKERGITVGAIVLTHGHFDHISGVAKLRQLSHCKIYAGTDEQELLGSEYLNRSEAMGIPVTVTPDELVRDGQELTLCDITMKVFATPGHTIGSVCYYVEEAGVVISGDTLFEGSVGRTDMPTGDMGAQIRSIKEKLLTLPDETIVYPGHGNSTTIGEEKKYNPFIA